MCECYACREKAATAAGAYKGPTARPTPPKPPAPTPPKKKGR